MQDLHQRVFRIHPSCDAVQEEIWVRSKAYHARNAKHVQEFFVCGDMLHMEMKRDDVSSPGIMLTIHPFRETLRSRMHTSPHPSPCFLICYSVLPLRIWNRKHMADKGQML